MGGCSAFNCTNHSRKGHRMFKFPSDPVRRRRWTINCRRSNWEPGPSAQICIVHFEESQFEESIKDWKKLKRNAIPTLFDVPNPPPTLTDKRQKGVGYPKPDTILAKKNCEKENSATNTDLLKRIEALEKENEMLKSKVKENNDKLSSLSSFLSDEQIRALQVPKSSIHSWSEEGIIKGLKLRLEVGKHGYDFLRSTGYPAPAHSTLNRWIQGIKKEYIH